MFAIGLYLLGPLRPDQWQAVLAGLRRLHAAGKRIAIHMTNWNGAAEVKQAMPDCLVFNRVCYTSHDGSPRGFLRRLLGRDKPDPRAPFGPTTVPGPRRIAGGWWSGEEWFNKYWPDLSQNVGADVYVWTNEWFGNRQPHDEVDKFITFYKQLMDACTARGITCTIGDFSVGTPGYPSIIEEAYDVPAMQEMLSQAERQGHWLNTHLYDVHAPGLVDRIYTLTRYKTLRKNHPNLKVIAGELANDPQDVGNRDGLFGGARSLDMMKEIKDVIDIPGCWWLVTAPEGRENQAEARWDLDNVSPILDSYFDWALTSS